MVQLLRFLGADGMMKKKKILLISANRLSNPYPVYPIGLSYIESYLRDHLPGFEVEMMDMNLRTVEELIDRLDNSDPDYVGISIRNVDDSVSADSFSFTGDYKELFRVVREHSGAVLITGGSAFSIFPEEYFKALNPDFGIQGEGELSMLKLIKTLENEADFSDIEGLIFSDGEDIRINPKSRSENIPAHLSSNDELTDFYWDKSGMLNIQTKRGCPRKCIYCTYPLIEGSNVRRLDVDKVIEDLEFFYFQKQINYFFITDSVFNIDHNYNRVFAEKLIERGIRINWGAYFSPAGLNREMLSLYRKAGLKHIEFGTDSFSDTQLNNYGKGFRFRDVLKSSGLCNELGIYFAHFLILGGFGETEETLQESFENSKRIRNAIIFPYIGMRIYPGTKLFSMAVKEGNISSGQNLLQPVHYTSKNIDLNTIRQRAKETGQKWIFPEEDFSQFIANLRANNRKGPLWHLIR